MSPAAESPQRFEPAVNGGGPQPLDLDQVLSIIDEIEGRELLESRCGSFSVIEPAQELAQVVAVTAYGGGREIVAL